MKTSTITEAKNGLSALIDQVRAGESILITDRGVAVARIEPVTTTPDAADRTRRLERTGLLRIGQASPPVQLLRKPGPALRRGASSVARLLEDRASR